MEIVKLWLPFLVLVGIWVFFMSRSRGRSNEMVELYRLHVAEATKQTAILERLAAALEKRNS